ncbi:hypothetical protein [Nonomuraea sp. SYSU D8015]|uniref:hypothetical protein n=1 Tax=Nonomuraea sp. SYSU D8015 TaxID=2593644 RepID=UPI00166141A2|nr:hypothetical protein [Nonomuraea sp. SYSU D8015]
MSEGHDAHEVHDVQALSDVDIHVYEAVAAQAVESGSAGLEGLVRASGLAEDELRGSLATLIGHGYVVPKGDGYGLGPHTFEVEY